MSITEIKVGDRLDLPARGLRDGEVLKVGRATVWLVFSVPGRGNLPVSADPGDLRLRVEHRSIQVGEFVLATLIEGRIGIRSVATGEAMETEAARLESWLARFWKKEF